MSKRQVEPMKAVSFVLFICVILLQSCDVFYNTAQDLQGKGNAYYLYFGNNSNSANGAVYKYEINMTTGSLSAVVTYGLGSESSFIAIAPSRKYLYSDTYSGTGINIHTIDGRDGSLGAGVHWNYGASPNGMILVHPNGNFILGTSLSTGEIYDVAISASDGTLSPANMPLSGSNSLTSGPKVFAIKPSGDFLYVANYNTNVINRYALNPLTGIISSPITAADQFATGTSPQAIVVHPSLPYLYVANDNPDETIQSYAINNATGALTPNGATVSIAGGPTCLVIDPTGNFLYCVNSWMPSTISGFRINQSNGTLSALTGSPYASTYSVSGTITLQYCAIDPTGKFLYAPVVNESPAPGHIEGFAIDQTTGNLTHLSDSGWEYPDNAAANPVIIGIEQ
jgi:6-phosphogluconolactonase